MKKCHIFPINELLFHLQIVQDIACTLHHCLKLNIIHCNLRAKNIFVDIKEDSAAKKERAVYYVGGFHLAVMTRLFPRITENVF
uniref:Protein kinase domain-containing protein n=1 Tax=Parascaris univalens TaxID=6257 RepID=A0A914ZE22_PARUN